MTHDVVFGPSISFSSIKKVGNILYSLSATMHDGFLVIDESPFIDAPKLCWLEPRSHLLVLLKENIFSRDGNFIDQSIFQRISTSDFGKA